MVVLAFEVGVLKGVFAAFFVGFTSWFWDIFLVLSRCFGSFVFFLVVSEVFRLTHGTDDSTRGPFLICFGVSKCGHGRSVFLVFGALRPARF